MNLDLGSLAFGSYLKNGVGTPSWGTALGQSKPDYKFTYPGAEAILIGMVYCSVPLEAVSLPLGRGGRIYQASELKECQLASLFRKVYINGMRIDYPFIVVLVKEESDSHSGRKSIKYSDKNAYLSDEENYSNQEFIRQARKTLGLKEDACWFIYNFEVYYQDELHMSAVIVDDANSVTYENSSERRNSWIDLIPETIDSDNRNVTFLSKNSESLQIIYYGAPGTGKSHCIKEDAAVKEADEKNLVFRTTFHPDSDYSTFVGAYKPTMRPVADKYKAVAGKDEEIAYSFVPQAFLQAYVAAWNNPDDKVFLVIEEINRGNCAQIFGDLFQLLDRDENGCSEYPIMADKDLAKYLNGNDEEGKPVLVNKDGIKDGKLCLPKNLHIWATMNTSDQSLFPIDSAFKRRWDWKYMPIDTKKETWYIKVGGINYSWTSFLDIVNARVLKATSSEDKQLGFYFCKAEDNIINAETFVSKVLFYLWNDVFKDYDDGESIFKDVDGTKLPFSGFYNTNGTINEPMVTKLLTSLKIEKNNSENLVEPDKVGNNFDRYSLNGSDPKGKSDLGLSIMKQYLSEHPDASFDEIKQVFPDSMLGNVANRGLIVEESIPLDSYTRYYTPELFTSADGIKFRIYKQWIAANIGNIIDFARSQGWNVEQAEQWDRKDNQA